MPSLETASRTWRCVLCGETVESGEVTLVVADDWSGEFTARTLDDLAGRLIAAAVKEHRLNHNVGAAQAIAMQVCRERDAVDHAHRQRELEKSESEVAG